MPAELEDSAIPDKNHQKVSGIGQKINILTVSICPDGAPRSPSPSFLTVELQFLNYLHYFCIIAQIAQMSFF